MEHEYIGDECTIQIRLDKTAVGGRRVENFRNCDIFIDDNALVIFLDVRTYKTRFQRPFDRAAIKNVEIKYNSSTRCLKLRLPCLPEAASVKPKQPSSGNDVNTPSTLSMPPPPSNKLYIIPTMDLWKLKRITSSCRIRMDNSEELLELESNFAYGFGSKYKGKPQLSDNIDEILRVTQPHLISPVQRRIDREIAELKDFSREQYKLNFVKLDVPEGHENPMKYKANVSDIKLSSDQQKLLHNIANQKKVKQLPKDFSDAELENGLVSILCAICYDIRTTGNEPTCQSGWTRSILTSALTYFEPFDSLKEALIAFLRRCLTYPLYRKYELGLQCISDVAIALRQSTPWVLKQLLVTHEMFSSIEPSCEVFNRYFIEDYVRYVNSILDASKLNELGHNVSNLMFDMNKRMLRMNLREIEGEFLHELIIAQAEVPEDDDDSSEDDELDDNYSFETDYDEEDDEVEEEEYNQDEDDDDETANESSTDERGDGGGGGDEDGGGGGGGGGVLQALSIGNELSNSEAEKAKNAEGMVPPLKQNVNHTNDNDGDDDDNGEEPNEPNSDSNDENDDEEWTTTDSSSETEENSVIEQSTSQLAGCGRKST